MAIPKSKTEEKQFKAVISRAKKKGYSKQRTMDALKPAQLQLKMQWMMTPVTSPESKTVAKDYKKSQRLMKYLDKKWKDVKVKDVV